MKIQSKFKDYYDSQMVFGADPKIFYSRQQKWFDLEKFKLLNKLNIRPTYICSNNYYSTNWHPSSDVYIKFEWVGFCGRLYKIAALVTKTNIEYFTTKKEFLNLLEIVKLSNNYELENIKNRLLNSKPKDYKKYVDSLIKNIEDPIDIPADIFKELGSPVFLFGGKGKLESDGYKYILANPNLKEIGWSRLFTPERCFQEISMYISNYLTEQMEMVEIDNKYKILQHGFNKCSFRNCK